MTSAQDAMKTLTAQYYNAVVTGCGLDPNTFQLIQAHMPLGTLSEDLWNIFDAVPPLSVTGLYNPSQRNLFSQDYGGVIAHLNPPGSEDFQAAMGDYYPQWATYLKTNPTIPDGGMLALFSNWAQLNIPDPSQAQKCITLYQQVSLNAISLAVEAWDNMLKGDLNPGIPAYSQTYGDLKNALSAGQPQSFTLDSSTASADLSHTWAKAETSGIFDFFWGGASANYEKWTSKISTAGVTINVAFSKLVLFPAGPLAKPSKDPILSGYAPWYNSEALNIAYKNNNNEVWQHGVPTWNGTFGPDGNLKRFCSALVIVDGITVTEKSTATIAKSDQQSFEAAIGGGFFPFFEASGSGGWSQSTSFEDDGSFSINSECSVGNPQILGVIVNPIAKVFEA